LIAKQYMPLKNILYNFCETFIGNRSARILNNIASLQQDLLSETKSSAGDKHETGRAIIQLEREKLGDQLAEVQLLQERVKKVPLITAPDRVRSGSVVYTTGHNYYLGVSAGEIQVDGVIFYAIAPDTPIGKLLLGKSVGEMVVFNTNEFRIREIR